MGKVKNTLTALALTGVIALSGCEQRPTTTQQETVVCQEIESGTNLRVMPITSGKHYWEDKQKQVKAKVEEVVNGGQYNIVSVKTFYSDNYLTSAEIKYSIADECDNQKLRIIFIHSGKHYWYDKQKKIKPQLEKIVNSGEYDIQDINTIMLEGYLVAAEIYYNKN